MKIKYIKILKRHLPILQWLPQYNVTKLLQDIIAGITVALTAIPQSIAYAIVSGLTPEYGLYSTLLGGCVYAIFGSCKDVTVGPTAILAALVAKYVMAHSADFAVLAAFLAGIIQLTLGVLQLGFIVEFISTPVISGFTTAAALQIASGQLKSFFGLEGKSGNFFLESVYYFIMNIRTAKLWDSLLTLFTIGILVILKYVGTNCKRNGNAIEKTRWFLLLARNAIVVILGIIIAYVLKITTNHEPLILIGDIRGGLPHVSPPPFSTTAGNETYYFKDMLNVYGFESLVIPIVAILETVAIAKAFSGGKSLDATQELIALGLCNIVGSFVRSMPVTGSFTRTALNHASGVQTTAGGILTSLIILLALSLLTSTFYYIPKASLAGLIVVAMYSMLDFGMFHKLWKRSKLECFVWFLTLVMCLGLGLEYGIVAGTVTEAVILLYRNSRPNLEIKYMYVGHQKVSVIKLTERVAYCAGEHVRRALLKAANNSEIIILDGITLKHMDYTVASNLIAIIKDFEEQNTKTLLFFNFDSSVMKTCTAIAPECNKSFKFASSYEECLVNFNSNNKL